MDVAVPRPTITPLTQPYWDALHDHRVVIQRCSSCRHWVHYPRIRCPFCGGAELRFEEVSGNGTVYSFTVTRQATAPFFADEVPQKIAIVELDCGVRLTSTIVTDRPETVRAGDRVTPVFDDGADGITLLRFGPAS
ncbi:MAG: Zn-ribbon domain-containing OB-fold protein [Acidimicrobiia bacterium]